MSKSKIKDIDKEIKKLQSRWKNDWSREKANPFDVDLRPAEKSELISNEERNLIIQVQKLLKEKSEERQEKIDMQVADLMNKKALLQQAVDKRAEKKSIKQKNFYKNCPYKVLEKQLIYHNCPYHSSSKSLVILKKDNLELAWNTPYSAYIGRCSPIVYSPPELVIYDLNKDSRSGSQRLFYSHKKLWEGEEYSSTKVKNNNFSVELVQEFQNEINEIFGQEVDLSWLKRSVTLVLEE